MITLFRWVARIGGLLAFVLGLMLTRVAPAALQIHMVLGGLVAAALAIIAISALATGTKLPVALAGLVWAAVTVYVGMTQRFIGAVGGPALEIIHPLLGIGAIGLAEMLGAAVVRKKASVS